MGNQDESCPHGLYQCAICLPTLFRSPKTTVVNVYAKEFKDRQYDIYIGRGSVWGNPFIIGTHGTRDEVIAQYRDYLGDHPELMAKVKWLKGKRLGCYCAPLPCHGDLLAKLADAYFDLDTEIGNIMGNEEVSAASPQGSQT